MAFELGVTDGATGAFEKLDPVVRLETKESVYIYEGPDKSFNRVANEYLQPGVVIVCDSRKGNWYHFELGWVYKQSDIFTDITTYSTTQNTTRTSQDAENNSSDSVEPGSRSIEDQIDIFATNDVETTSLQNLRGIHALPFHFLNSTDIYMSNISPGTNTMHYGRKFTERIISRMPLLVLTPGKPAFLQGFSKAEKDSFVTKALNSAVDTTELEEVLNVDSKDGRYYQLEFDYANYYKYVNGMCWATARLMGIGNEPLYGRTYGGQGNAYDWGNYSKHASLKGFFSGSEFVPFYIESENQISESFSNSTGESMLDQGLNKMSDLGKEMDFLLGAGAGMKVDALSADNYEANMAEISKIMGSYSDPSYIMERLKSGFVTVAGGGQLIFPEIWKDSSFSKSYDVTIKLISPYGDDKSIYRNIFVPLFHLMGFVVPQQMGMNGYRSPFLVRGYYKGIFNIDMGIITSMSISKGGEGSWNINGLPTEVEVTLNIKDLYEILTMSKYDEKLFIKNQPMFDFLANMAGISINKPELFRAADMWISMKTNTVTKLPANVWRDVSNSISNKLMDIFR